VCAAWDVPVVEPETTPDRVRLLVTVARSPASTRVVKQIKGRSSRLLRQEFPHLRSRLPTLRTNSYFVATVGGASLEVAKRYVENQRNV
jgi:putative transposase